MKSRLSDGIVAYLTRLVTIVFNIGNSLILARSLSLTDRGSIGIAFISIMLATSFFTSHFQIMFLKAHSRSTVISKRFLLQVSFCIISLTLTLNFTHFRLISFSALYLVNLTFTFINAILMTFLIPKYGYKSLGLLGMLYSLFILLGSIFLVLMKECNLFSIFSIATLVEVFLTVFIKLVLIEGNIVTRSTESLVRNVFSSTSINIFMQVNFNLILLAILMGTSKLQYAALYNVMFSLLAPYTLAFSVIYPMLHDKSYSFFHSKKSKKFYSISISLVITISILYSQFISRYLDDLITNKYKVLQETSSIIVGFGLLLLAENLLEAKRGYYSSTEFSTTRNFMRLAPMMTGIVFANAFNLNFALTLLVLSFCLMCNIYIKCQAMYMKSNLKK